MMHVLHVVGARPNYMKMAPVHRALDGQARQTLIHTGQHYDRLMSDIFFQQLGMPEPDVNLGIGSASHAVQTARTMTGLEHEFLRLAPELVLVYGDVNSTVAAALVCSKLLIPVGHVEAGLRSRDRMMPEEINRLVTDAIADMLFTPSQDGDRNLLAEGVSPAKIHFVGNVMIDTLVRLLPLADGAGVRRAAGAGERYVLVTLHRPSNVDDPVTLTGIFSALTDLADGADVIFPVHPRTRDRLARAGAVAPARLKLIDPVGYLEFLGLQRDAALVVTDSGGIQEETTFLGVPCLTVRENTERPITIEMGTNELVGQDPRRMLARAREILEGARIRGATPPLWDGRAGERIAAIVAGVRAPQAAG